jgi:DNA polymerase-3 subunit beta
MKQEIEIRPDSIRDILTIAQNIVPKKSLMPILDNICLIISNEVLTVIAGSLETQVTMTIELPGVEENFSCAVPASTFCNVFNSLYVDKVKIIKHEEDNSVIIKNGRNKYTMPFYKVDEYPILDVVNASEPIRIDGEAISRYIKKASMLTSSSDVRSQMCSINLEVIDNEFYIMGTDAHQGGVLSIPCSGEMGSSLISRDAGNIMQMIRFNGPTTITKGGSSIMVTCGNSKIVSRVVEANYVPLFGMFKNKNEGFITVGRTNMNEALKRINLFTNIQSHKVSLAICGNEMTLLAKNEDSGRSAVEVLEIVNSGIEDIELGFNTRFLSNMFNLIESVDVNMYITTVNKPIYFSSSVENTREHYLALPMIL